MPSHWFPAFAGMTDGGGNDGFSSTVHGNDIAVEAQRNKLRLVIETAQEVWGTN